MRKIIEEALYLIVSFILYICILSLLMMIISLAYAFVSGAALMHILLYSIQIIALSIFIYYSDKFRTYLQTLPGRQTDSIN